MKNSPIAFLQLMRPHQWIKNCFVFTGLFFGHRWGDATIVADVVVAAFSFSLMSSAVYIFNDIGDCETDRLHPKKKTRPLAAGRVSLFAASILSIILALTASFLAAAVSKMALIIVVGYAGLNIAYSLRFKNIVILDVFCIAAGFMLRILAGTTGVGIPPSKWLLLCGLMITLFLGFAKRRAEVVALAKKRGKHRSVLDHYSSALLDEVGAICATGAIITYSLYTTSEQTAQVHNTENLVFTVPYVMYALFRYIFLVHKRQAGGEPGHDIFKDRHIIAAILGWAITTVIFIV